MIQQFSAEDENQQQGLRCFGVGTKMLDYSQLNQAFLPSWKTLYDDNQTLSENLLSILKRTVFLPNDFYENARRGNVLPEIPAREIKAKIDFWHARGILTESPSHKQVARTMYSLGYRQRLKNWIKD